MAPEKDKRPTQERVMSYSPKVHKKAELKGRTTQQSKWSPPYFGSYRNQTATEDTGTAQVEGSTVTWSVHGHLGTEAPPT